MKLTAQKREILGKKVKNIRNSGNIPASVFGPSRESTSIIINPIEFTKIFKQVEYNKFFDLEIEGEKGSVKTLVKDVQTDPVKDNIIHVSLYEIDMKKKLTVEIPVHFEGISPAVKNNLGFLVILSENLKIQCLPKDIPGSFTVDLTKLENVNDAIHVGDIKLEEGVEWDSNLNADTVIARIAPPQKEVVEVVAEEVPAEGEATAVEGAPAEGAEKAEEKK